MNHIYKLSIFQIIMALGKLITGFVLIVLGLSLIAVLATQVNNVTELTATSQSIDLSSARPVALTTVANESGSINETGYTLLYGGGTFDSGVLIVAVLNATDDTEVASGNWTFNPTTRVITNATEVIWSEVKITYTYNTTITVNESYEYTLTNAVTQSWQDLYSECPVTSVTVSNATTPFTVTTDYVFTSGTGILTFVNSTAVRGSPNTLTATYDYCATGYFGGWANSVLVLVPGFFAIALLGIGVWFVYGVMKEYGIL